MGNSRGELVMEYARLENSQIDLKAHNEGECMLSEACTIHNRTNHHMRHFKQFYRFDRGIMERICSHGTGHPDPDDYKIITGADNGEHGCDGCCIRFATEEEYADSQKYGE
jgi:hypothetical protein